MSPFHHIYDGLQSSKALPDVVEGEDDESEEQEPQQDQHQGHVHRGQLPHHLNIYRVSGLSCPEAGGCNSAIL